MDSQTKTELFHMYQSYKRELWTYTGQNFEDELQNWFEDMMTMPDMEVKPIRNAHTNALIGFLMVQDLDKKQQAASGCRWFISEAYIMPAYRNQRFMTTVIHDFVAQHKGNIGLVTINKNDKATRFWEYTFSGLEYTKERVDCLSNATDSFYKFTAPSLANV
jgi:predicted acetyltransferase